MKKKIILGAACFSVISLYAQDSRSNQVAPEAPAPPIAVIAPAPPAPPEPPLPPDPPPPPPAPPTMSENEEISNTIINDNGSEIVVRNIKGVPTVVVKKDGKTIHIKLSTWNANPKYYEKKYGKLPPPPPPPPPPPVMEEEAKFTPPVIKKDN
ncbi:MAG: hypothetical protein U0T68_09295 [Ferruginibacter sp.]